jgi:hypothetical protein
MAVKVAGSSLSFSKQPLDVALRELANLGFSFVDIGAIEGWAHINPSEVASQPQKFVEKLRTQCASSIGSDPSLSTQDLELTICRSNNDA